MINQYTIESTVTERFAIYVCLEGYTGRELHGQELKTASYQQ